jgi:hypothetical protein
MYLKAFCSPFKRPSLRWYFGKIAIGVPYFLPRKWVKDPTQPGYRISVPRKVGFDHCSLGWKTKWTNTDYRYEYSPILSFVFFKWQIAVTVWTSHPDPYWTAFLFYNYKTKGTQRERIEQCKKEFPLMFTSYKPGKPKEQINYYDIILKEKYNGKKTNSRTKERQSSY